MRRPVATALHAVAAGGTHSAEGRADGVESFTPWTALTGGALIGLATASVFWLQGRLAGISGICGALLAPARGDASWRVAFLIGLLAVGAFGTGIAPEAFSTAAAPSLAWVAGAGLLVGFGTRLGNGCTSGHGVCGIARLSPRSIAATLVFMAVAGVISFLLRHVLGAVS
jgi:uncharacterized membrane protein YedE/YeeE